MSAKDNVPAGEVEDKKTNFGANFDSPNITNASDNLDEPVVDEKEEARKAAQKKAETVDIDGVPIPEAEQKFKSEKIKARDDKELFVNVDRREVEKKERKTAKKAEAERRKVISADKARQRRAKFEKNRKKIFTSIAAVMACIICIVGGFFIYKYIEEQQRIYEETRQRDIYDLTEQDKKNYANYGDAVQKFGEAAALAGSPKDDIGEDGKLSNGYQNACKKAEELIANAESNSEKMFLVTLYAKFMVDRGGDPESAIKYLDENINQATEEFEIKYFYAVYTAAYAALGDTENEDKYQNLYNELLEKETSRYYEED